jgi:hypothetical protein
MPSTSCERPGDTGIAPSCFGGPDHNRPERISLEFSFKSDRQPGGIQT